jgi:hypothetical protein
MLTLPSSSARRLKNYIGTQVAWSKITSRITQDDPDTVIAFGDASFNHASKGHHATPNVRAKKEFAKKARVRLTNEHRTSVACSAPSCPEESMHEPGAQTEHWQVKVSAGRSGARGVVQRSVCACQGDCSLSLSFFHNPSAAAAATSNGIGTSTRRETSSRASCTCSCTPAPDPRSSPTVHEVQLSRPPTTTPPPPPPPNNNRWPKWPSPMLGLSYSVDCLRVNGPGSWFLVFYGSECTTHWGSSAGRRCGAGFISFRSQDKRLGAAWHTGRLRRVRTLGPAESCTTVPF